MRLQDLLHSILPLQDRSVGSGKKREKGRREIQKVDRNEGGQRVNLFNPSRQQKKFVTWIAKLPLIESCCFSKRCFELRKK